MALESLVCLGNIDFSRVVNLVRDISVYVLSPIAAVGSIYGIWVLGVRAYDRFVLDKIVGNKSKNNEKGEF